MAGTVWKPVDGRKREEKRGRVRKREGGRGREADVSTLLLSGEYGGASMRESVAAAIQRRVIEPWLLLPLLPPHSQLQRLHGRPNGGSYCSCTSLLQLRPAVK